MMIHCISKTASMRAKHFRDVLTWGRLAVNESFMRTSPVIEIEASCVV